MNDDCSSVPHRLPETPATALGPTIQERVAIAGHSFLLCRPDAVDRLDDEAVGDGSATGEYMPFWAHLWPGARLLAQVILEEPWPDDRTGEPPRALEIGCGLGLPGMAALSRGWRVIFSDYDAAALRYAAEGARLNGFVDYTLLQLDWRWPPRDLRVPLVLGSDVAYEMRMVQPLVNLLNRVLTPEGTGLLLERDRLQTPALLAALLASGLSYTSREIRADDQTGNPLRGTLYRIRRDLHVSTG